jgi:hypothetical protein
MCNQSTDNPTHVPHFKKFQGIFLVKITQELFPRKIPLVVLVHVSHDHEQGLRSSVWSVDRVPPPPQNFTILLLSLLYEYFFHFTFCEAAKHLVHNCVIDRSKAHYSLRACSSVSHLMGLRINGYGFQV